jgi:hypothetical protein
LLPLLAACAGAPPIASYPGLSTDTFTEHEYQAAEPLGLSGYVTGLAWSAGCHQDNGQIKSAYARYVAAHTPGLLPLGIPGSPAADPCKILGQFAEKNTVLTVGKTAIRDCMNANASSACTVKEAAWNFHGIGTNSTGATAADTGCGTEATTQYNPDNTRATGSQTTNGTTTYRTIGTNTVDASIAVVEWCLFSNATVGSGTALSHVVFASISLSSGDSLQTTYDFTLSKLTEPNTTYRMVSIQPKGVRDGSQGVRNLREPVARQRASLLFSGLLPRGQDWTASPASTQTNRTAARTADRTPVRRMRQDGHAARIESTSASPSSALLLQGVLSRDARRAA